jgi:pimeloyl-ACP methyl ester carboxylesterase
MNVVGPPAAGFKRRMLVVDGLATSFLEAGVGNGDPLVLLHGGEFGASAELGWERNIGTLASCHHVIAPDQLGYGQTAKAIDFNDGRRMRIRHVARLCDLLDIESAGFVGNSMGGVNLLVDSTSARPLLPVHSMIVICGGGEILRNRYSSALFEYDASFEGMRKIVEALFHDPSYPANDAYVQRRYESSIAPGAWEAIAAARFRRPGPPDNELGPKEDPQYERIDVPTLMVAGGDDKLKPVGWAAEIAKRIPEGDSLVVDNAAHCPQVEQPELVNQMILDFFAARGSRATVDGRKDDR